MIKNLCVAILVLFGADITGQDVSFSLSSPRQSIENSDTFHLVDVLMYSHVGFKLGSGQFYLNYNNEAFGENVIQFNNADVLVDSSSLLSLKLGTPPFQFNFYGQFVTNDNTASRISFSWQHNFSEGCLEEANVNYYMQKICTIKIKFLEGKTNEQPIVCFESGSLYDDQTFTVCGPGDCNSVDCLENPGNQLENDRFECSNCLIVFNTFDVGIGTLRDALLCAQPGDTIRFAPGLRQDTIRLTSSAITFNEDLYLITRPTEEIFLTAESLDRVLEVPINRTIYIEGLNIVGVLNDTEANGILNSGTLTLKDVVLYDQMPSDTNAVLKNLGDLTFLGSSGIKQ